MTHLPPRRTLPAEGLAANDVLERLGARRGGDWPWRAGRSFSLVYHAGDAHEELLRSAYGLYLAENGLSARAFPSLASLEADVVAITADLLAGDPGTVVGAMTAGGTESIVLAMKAYRDRARAGGAAIARPEIVLPRSAHPAFLKAAAYLDLTPVIVDCRADFRADAPAMAAACTAHTIVLVASAPSFPQGVVDPIDAIGEAARARGIGLHVDASLGSFMLPFAERLGRTIPPWDFRVPGVTSMSADLHKFGYAAKGASVVLYRGAELRRHQFFVTDQWSGGIFASPGVLGTRPGGAVAAAWAALHALGESGYRQLVAGALKTTERLQNGIRSLGLRVLGTPEMSVFAFESDGRAPLAAIADGMERRGWRLDRLQRPDSIHLIVTAAHQGVVEPFLADLEASMTAARARLAAGSEPSASKSTSVLYGMTGDVAGSGDPMELAVAGLETRWTVSATESASSDANDEDDLRREIALPLASLLARGGDERLLVDPAEGVNRYGCSPTPDPRVSARWSSCSASSAHSRAFAAAAQAHAVLIAAARSPERGGASAGCERLADDVRRRILALAGCRAGTADVVLTPSGTDAECIPPLLVAGPPDASVVTIMVASDDTGLGSALAAQGLHFSHELPSGASATPGERLDGYPDVRAVRVPLRDGNGFLIPAHEIDRQVEEAAEEARRGGAHVILHFMPCTKTGARAPSIDQVARLVQRHGHAMLVVVDASQLRPDAETIAHYLELGYVTIVTGTKFFSAPPFAGAVLVPRALAAARRPLPAGLRDYLSRADVPSAWTDWLGVLNRSANPGLLLRWSAALGEMSAFAELPHDVRDQTMAALVSEMRAAAHASFSAVPLDTWETRDGERGDESILAFELRHVDRGRLAAADMALVHERMRLPDGPAHGHGPGYLLGRPLALGCGGRAALRIAIGAPVVVDIAQGGSSIAIDQRLTAARAELRALFTKLDRIVAEVSAQSVGVADLEERSTG